MIFIRFTPDIFEVAAHLDGRLCHLGQVGVFELIIADGFFHFGVQKSVSSSAVKFREDAGSIEGNPLRAAHFEQDVHDGNGVDMPFARCIAAEISGKPNKNPTASSLWVMTLINFGSA